MVSKHPELWGVREACIVSKHPGRWGWEGDLHGQ